MAGPKVHFDDVLPLAADATRRHLPDTAPSEIRFVRDVYGYLSVVVPDRITTDVLSALRGELDDRLGDYSPGFEQVALRVSDTLDGDDILRLSRPVLVHLLGDNWPAYQIEQWIAGQDWLAPRAAQAVSATPRVTFYSLKGGVGRSTALVLWARRLAAQGRRVLVADLDLEAPGIGNQLLDAEALPRFGVLDWLSDRLVGGACEEMVDDLVRPSPMASGNQLLVLPASGVASRDHPHNFMAKLARAYAGGDPTDARSGFAQRIEELFDAIERRHRPDVILIDSKAGLHETAASALLQFNAMVLLFAADLSGTWEGYRYLLSHLGQIAQGDFARSQAGALPASSPDWRYQLRMVHAKAPPLLSANQAFTENAYSVWSETLYDEEGAGDIDLDAFSFARNDESAPHMPFRILRNDIFENIDLRGHADDLDSEAVDDAFGRFFDELEAWVFKT